MSPPDPAGGGRVVHCPGCGKRYRIHDAQVPAGVTNFPCRGCGKSVPLGTRLESANIPGPGAPRVLLALNESELTALVMRILHRGGMEGAIAHTGEQAYQMLEKDGYSAFFLSVALPDLMGFELIERARALPKGPQLPILLLSSLFRPTRYKRAPTSLYGADDYIEMHHLPDFLIPKLRAFIDGGRSSRLQKPGPGSLVLPSSEELDEVRQIEQLAPEAPRAEEGELSPAAQRMARIIVADIVLYNEEAIDGRPPGDVLGSLQRDLGEGIRLMGERFPELPEEAASRLLEQELGRFLAGRGSPRGSGG